MTTSHLIIESPGVTKSARFRHNPYAGIDFSFKIHLAPAAIGFQDGIDGFLNEDQSRSVSHTYVHASHVSQPPPPSTSLFGRSFHYSSLAPLKTIDEINVRALSRQPNRCVKVGGVIMDMDAPTLCALIAEAFGVVPLGAQQRGVGFFVVALDDFKADFGKLSFFNEQMWMGPNFAVLPSNDEEKKALDAHLLKLRLQTGFRCLYPRHTMTFLPWTVGKTNNSG